MHINKNGIRKIFQDKFFMNNNRKYTNYHIFRTTKYKFHRQIINTIYHMFNKCINNFKKYVYIFFSSHFTLA